jgi:hypothetical protein
VAVRPTTTSTVSEPVGVNTKRKSNIKASINIKTQKEKHTLFAYVNALM